MEDKILMGAQFSFPVVAPCQYRRCASLRSEEPPAFDSSLSQGRFGEGEEEEALVESLEGLPQRREARALDSVAGLQPMGKAVALSGAGFNVYYVVVLLSCARLRRSVNGDW